MRRRLVRILGWEFNVIAAVPNGEDLLRAAMNLSPDVIVCDPELPMLTGVKAEPSLKERGKDIPFVFVCNEDDVSHHLAGASGRFVHRWDVAIELNMAVRSAQGGKAFLSSRCLFRGWS